MAVDTPSSAQQKQLLNVIWFAMLAAVGSYTVVCLLMVGMDDAGRRAENDGLRYAFTAVAAVMGALSAWWRWRWPASSALWGCT